VHQRSRRPLLAATSLAAALCLCSAAWASASPAAAPLPTPDAAELRLAVQRLTVLGTALHVGAHPDDENTALLAYLARGRLVRAAYLSLTRGDGGQNLIGKETGELLGVIRTQELLAARRIDGAEQRFTRAVDFGYSKSPAETLSIWDRQAVLADVVRVVRELRPDVVITRFPTDGRGGHGHHTASAILALEAFEAAGDPARFAEQLGALRPWRPKRVVWNAFRPRGGEAEGTAEPPAIQLDLGAYNPLLGRSYSEIAAESRSQHKSQGFGSEARRGSRLDRFVHLAGEPARQDLFDGVDLSWRRLPGGERVGALLDEAVARFEAERPAGVVPVLLEALAALDELAGAPATADPWIAVKRAELLEVIRAAAGLWLEAIAAEPEAAPGEVVEVTATAVLRSAVPLRLLRLEPTGAAPVAAGVALEENRPLEQRLALRLAAEAPLSQPHWLRQPAAKGVFRVADPALAGLPEAPPSAAVRFVLTAWGRELAYTLPVLCRWTDPVEGERYRALAVAPPVAVDLDAGALLFPTGEPRPVQVTLRAGAPGVSGTLRLEAPAGWAVDPPAVPFALDARGEERAFAFTVTPPGEPGVGVLRGLVEAGAARLDRGRLTLDYPHIPPQTLFPPAEARLVRLDLETRGRRIGYVMGAGDEVPEALRQVGYEVVLLADADLESGDLAGYDAIVLGVRAYNTRQVLARANGRLLAYVEAGGTLVVQYNTAADLVLEGFAPFPLEISRGRVTVEEAPVVLLAPDHPLLTTPNRITAADFAGWVQERGLHFPGERDPRYETVVAMADPGEEALPGGILFVRHGRGAYVYTSLAFFRQLPAGVPGALRLFVNLLSARP
jgi:LmbE family N-acetylglucosaminyl deacetylase